MGTKTNFFYDHFSRFRLNLFLFLFLLVKKLLVIYDLAYRGICVWRYLHQIEVEFICNSQGFIPGVNAGIINIITDNPYSGGPDSLINCELRGLFSGFVISSPASFKVRSCYGTFLLSLVIKQINSQQVAFPLPA